MKKALYKPSVCRCGICRACQCRHQRRQLLNSRYRRLTPQFDEFDPFFEALEDEFDEALDEDFDEFDEGDSDDDWLDEFDELESWDDIDLVGEIPSDVMRQLITHLRLSWPYFKAYGYSLYAVATRVLSLVRQGLPIRVAIQEARRQMHQEYQQKQQSAAPSKSLKLSKLSDRQRLKRQRQAVKQARRKNRQRR